MKKIIFIILDGLGDRPILSLNNQTPLESAKTPNLDKLAKEGVCGIIQVLKPGVIPHSDDAHLTLFGYDLKREYPGRGPIEAAGIGLKLKQGDVALRSNLETVDENLTVIDRRAGRIESTKPFTEKFDGIKINNVKFIVKPGTGYRAIIVLRGKNLSDKITDSDPKKVGKKINTIKPSDSSKEAKFTAAVLNKFILKTNEVLKNDPLNKERIKKGLFPGNIFLTRGAGYVKKQTTFKERYGLKACCIAGAGLYKGLGAVLGMDVLKVKGATGLPNTNVKAKFNAAINALKKYDFVFVHVKPTDSLGEDGNVNGKKAFIEKIDEATKLLLNRKELIVITADHSTPCECKTHSSDPVPLLIHGENIKPDIVIKFSEKECSSGSLGLVKGKDLMKKIMNLV